MSTEFCVDEDPSPLLEKVTCPINIFPHCPYAAACLRAVGVDSSGFTNLDAQVLRDAPSNLMKAQSTLITAKSNVGTLERILAVVGNGVAQSKVNAESIAEKEVLRLLPLVQQHTKLRQNCLMSGETSLDHALQA